PPGLAEHAPALTAPLHDGLLPEFDGERAGEPEAVDLLREVPLVHLLGAAGRRARLCPRPDHRPRRDAVLRGTQYLVAVLVVGDFLRVVDDVLVAHVKLAHHASQGIFGVGSMMLPPERTPSSVHARGRTSSRPEATF